MGDRSFRSDDNKKIMYKDANSLYVHPMSEPLPYDEIKLDKNVKLEDIINNPDDSDIRYFVEFDLTYPDIIKQESKYFPFAPEHKKIIPDNFTKYMNENKSNTYRQIKKLKCEHVIGVIRKTF